MRTHYVEQMQTEDAVLNSSTRATGEFSCGEKGLPVGIEASQLQGPLRDELIVSHLATVRYVAKRVHERLPQSVELDELISAGLLGLIDAASKFDWTKQVQFKSYAQFRIRGAILDSLRSMDWSPRELRRKSRAMSEAIRELAAQLGRTPVDSEVAEQMGMDLASFQQMTGELKTLEVSSLNEERSDEAEDEELDFLAAPAEESPLALCVEAETRQQLADAIEDLPEKERLVLTFYYFDSMTMKEIGMALGVVESRVSQIRSSAIARLKKGMMPGPRPLRKLQPSARLN